MNRKPREEKNESKDKDVLVPSREKNKTIPKLTPHLTNGALSLANILVEQLGALDRNKVGARRVCHSLGTKE